MTGIVFVIGFIGSILLLSIALTIWTERYKHRPWFGSAVILLINLGAWFFVFNVLPLFGGALEYMNPAQPVKSDGGALATYGNILQLNLNAIIAIMRAPGVWLLSSGLSAGLLIYQMVDERRKKAARAR